MKRSTLGHIGIAWWSHVLASQVLAMALALVWYFLPPASAPPARLTEVLLLIFLAPAWSPLFFLVLPVYTIARGHQPSGWLPAGFALYAVVFAVYFRHRKRMAQGHDAANED